MKGINFFNPFGRNETEEVVNQKLVDELKTTVGDNNKINELLNNKLEESPSLDGDLEILYPLELAAVSTDNEGTIKTVHNQFALRFYLAKMADGNISNSSLEALFSLKEKLGTYTYTYTNEANDTVIAQGYYFDYIIFEILSRDSDTYEKINRAFDDNKDVIKDDLKGKFARFLAEGKKSFDQRKSDIELVNSKNDEAINTRIIELLTSDENAPIQQIFVNILNNADSTRINNFLDKSIEVYGLRESIATNQETVSQKITYAKEILDDIKSIITTDTPFNIPLNIEEAAQLANKIRKVNEYGVGSARLLNLIYENHNKDGIATPDANDLEGVKNFTTTISNIIGIFGASAAEELSRELGLGFAKYNGDFKKLESTLDQLKNDDDFKNNWSTNIALLVINQAIDKAQKEKKEVWLKELVSNITTNANDSESLGKLGSELKNLRQNQGQKAEEEVAKFWIDKNVTYDAAKENLKSIFAELLKNPQDREFTEKVDAILMILKALLDKDENKSQLDKEEQFKEFIETSVKGVIEDETQFPIKNYDGSNKKDEKEKEKDKDIMVSFKEYFANDVYFDLEKLPNHVDALQHIKHAAGVKNYNVTSSFGKYTDSDISGVFVVRTPLQINSNGTKLEKKGGGKNVKYSRKKSNTGYEEACFKQDQISIDKIGEDLIPIKVGKTTLLTSLDGPSVRKSGKTFDVAFAFPSRVFDAERGSKSSANKYVSENYNNKAFLPVELDGQNYLVEVTFHIEDCYGSYAYNKRTDIGIRLLQQQDVAGNPGGYSEVAVATNGLGNNVKWRTTAFSNPRIEKALKDLEKYTFNVVSQQCERSSDDNKIKKIESKQTAESVSSKPFSLGPNGEIDGSLGSAIPDLDKGSNYHFEGSTLTFGKLVGKRRFRWGKRKIIPHIASYSWNKERLFGGIEGEEFEMAITDLLSSDLRDIKTRDDKKIVIDLSQSPKIYSIKSLPNLIQDLVDKGFTIEKIKLDGCNLWGERHDAENRGALNHIEKILKNKNKKLFIDNDISIEGLKRTISKSKPDKEIDLSKFGLRESSNMIALAKFAIENGKKVKFAAKAEYKGVIFFRKEKFSNISALTLVLDLSFVNNKEGAKALSERLIKAIKEYPPEGKDLDPIVKLQKKLSYSLGDKKTKDDDKDDKKDFRKEIKNFQKEVFALLGYESLYPNKEEKSYDGKTPIDINEETNFLLIKSSHVDANLLAQLKNLVLTHPNLEAITFDDKCGGSISGNQIHEFFDKFSKESGGREIKITAGNPATTVNYPKASKVQESPTKVTGVSQKR